MKSIIVKFGLACFLFVTLQMVCHSQNKDTLGLDIECLKVGDSIMVRWAPINPKSWDHCMKYGYTLKRYTISSNGIYNTFNEMSESELVLVDSMRPLTEEQWEDLPDSTDEKGVAEGALYEEKFITINLDSSSVQEKISAFEEKQNRFAYGLYAANKSYNVAKYMQLAYTDYNITSNKRYMYVISPAVIDTNYYILDGTVMIHSDSNFQLPKIQIDYSVSGKFVLLNWNILNIDDFYHGYYIEAKVGSETTFSRVNDELYTPLLNEYNSTHAFYTDSIPSTTDSVQYRVFGMSKFGIGGPFSNIITVKQQKEAEPVSTDIDEISELSNGSVKVEWKQALEGNPRIKSYKLLRAPHPDSNYVQINQNDIPFGTSEFIDANPLPTAYYKIVTVDSNNFEHKSIQTLSQMVDTVAPSIPTILSAKTNQAGLVEFNWTRSPEYDVLGYKVYFSNSIDGNYAEITKEILLDTTFYQYVDLDNISKDLYYKVSSIDKRYNISDFSSPYLVERPDIIPPSPPVFISCNPEPGKVKLEFRFSTTNDCDKHIIQRKTKNARIWQSLIVFNGPQQDHNIQLFFDSLASFKKTYDYRIAAFDKAKNMSTSVVFSVRPLIPPVRGNISNLDYQVYSTQNSVSPAIYVATTNQFLYKEIMLSWDYSIPEDVQDFVIYRQVGNGQMRVLATVDEIYLRNILLTVSRPNKPYFFLDNDLLKKRAYQQNLLNGGQSTAGSGGGSTQGGGTTGTGGHGGSGGPVVNNSTPNLGTDIYRYQIIARHKDGSMSNPSQIISIQF
ncbi:MAG TPA: hypothetical protein PKD32_10190 [Saprospiraceae bacterium]|nr:hypothetical protein [Saprospiraceae bacterium]